MELSISISSGRGTVKGQGEYESGDTITLSAQPLGIQSFSKFVFSDDGRVVTENPYSFKAGHYNIAVRAYFYIFMSTYLKNRVAFPVSDDVVESILYGRGINPDADVDSISEDLKSLCYADLLMWGITLPSSSGGKKESDFGWSSQEETRTITDLDKRNMRKIAMDIYKILDPSKYSASLKFVSLNGKPYVRKHF